MAIYRDPREAVVTRLLARFPGNPVVLSISRKYKSSGQLPDRDWKILESMDVVDKEPALSPEFEKQVAVWLMDLGLTLQDVMELSSRKKGQRALLDQQSTTPRVVVTRRPPQAKTIQELREMIRINRERG